MNTDKVPITVNFLGAEFQPGAVWTRGHIRILVVMPHGSYDDWGHTPPTAMIIENGGFSYQDYAARMLTGKLGVKDWLSLDSSINDTHYHGNIFSSDEAERIAAWSVLSGMTCSKKTRD
jgi:hypothetical protein